MAEQTVAWHVAARVRRYERGWLHLDKRVDLHVGTEIALGTWDGRPICVVTVTAAKGAAVRTDLALFFATDEDTLLVRIDES